MLLTPPPISGLLLLIVFIFDESPIESPLSLSKHNSFTIQIFKNHLQLLTPSIYLRSVVYVKQSSIISRRTSLTCLLCELATILYCGLQQSSSQILTYYKRFGNLAQTLGAYCWEYRCTADFIDLKSKDDQQTSDVDNMDATTDPKGTETATERGIGGEKVIQFHNILKCCNLRRPY